LKSPVDGKFTGNTKNSEVNGKDHTFYEVKTPKGNVWVSRDGLNRQNAPPEKSTPDNRPPVRKGEIKQKYNCPRYSQGDPKWRGDMIRTKSVGKVGCLMR
jgi:hypothetical protein